MTRRPPNPFQTPGESAPDKEREGSEERSTEAPTPAGPEDLPPAEPRREPHAPPPPPFRDATDAEPGREEDSGAAGGQGPAWPAGQGAPQRAEQPDLEAPHRPDRPGRLQRGTIPIFDTLREAASLINHNRRTVLMPLVVVTIPVAVIAALLPALMFVTVWRHEPVVTTGTLTTDATTMMIFFLVLITAVEALFTQVARAATIVAVAGVARGSPPSLTEALDPAFNRIGGILVLIAVIVMIVGVGLLTLIGLIVMPYLLLRLAIAFDAYMIEDGSPWSALGRSWSLMQGNMLRLLGLLGLAAICVLPFFVILSLLAGMGEGARSFQILWMAFWGVLQAIVILPIVAFFTACTTLYYLKARAIEDEARVA